MTTEHETDPTYGYTVYLRGVAFDDVRTKITEALKQKGFGILKEIDVKATLKAKLDRDFRRYVILGACNPQLAHQALQAELGMGLLLPCNVCVWEEDGGSVVSIARPEALFEVVGRDDVQPVAHEADERLRRALEQVKANAACLSSRRWRSTASVVRWRASAELIFQATRALSVLSDGLLGRS